MKNSSVDIGEYNQTQALHLSRGMKTFRTKPSIVNSIKKFINYKGAYTIIIEKINKLMTLKSIFRILLSHFFIASAAGSKILFLMQNKDPGHYNKKITIKYIEQLYDKC